MEEILLYQLNNHVPLSFSKTYPYFHMAVKEQERRDNEAWLADTFQSRKSLVEPGNMHAVRTSKWKIQCSKCITKVAFMVVCFIYAKSNKAEQV